MKLLKAVQFLEDGSAAFEFMDLANDVRANGLVQHRVLFVPVEAYAEQIEALQAEGLSLLAKGLADFATEAPVQPLSQDEDDDEVSPYDNPAERPVESA